MSGTYDDEIVTAQELIAEFGQQIIWQQITSVEGNSNEPWEATANKVIEYKPYICFVPIADKEWRKLIARLKDSEVPTGKLAGLMGNQKFTPALKDVIIRKINGIQKKLTVVNLDAIAPNEQIILWIMELAEL